MGFNIIKEKYLEDNFIRKVILGVVILALVWTGNIYYYHQHQLSKAQFMTHYYDLYGRKTIIFNLYYLVNREDDLEVISIYFPKLDYHARLHPSGIRQREGYYKIKTVHVEIDKEELKPPDGEKILVQEGVISFSDGTTENHELGKLYFNLEDQPSHLVTHSVGSRSDNTGYTYLRAKERVTVSGLESSFREDFDDVFDIMINNTPLSEGVFPFQAGKNDRIDVKYSLSFNGEVEDPRQHIFLNFSMSLLTENEEGQKGRSYFSMNYFPVFEFDDLKKIVRQGEEH